MSVGKAILSKRLEASLSQDKFAEKMGVARQTVSSWENDKFLPDTTKIIEMSVFFKCSTDDLLTSNPTTPPRRKQGRPKKARKLAAGII